MSTEVMLKSVLGLPLCSEVFQTTDESLIAVAEGMNDAIILKYTNINVATIYVTPKTARAIMDKYARSKKHVITDTRNNDKVSATFNFINDEGVSPYMSVNSNNLDLDVFLYGMETERLLDLCLRISNRGR